MVRISRREEEVVYNIQRRSFHNITDNAMIGSLSRQHNSLCGQIKVWILHLQLACCGPMWKSFNLYKPQFPEMATTLNLPEFSHLILTRASHWSLSIVSNGNWEHLNHLLKDTEKWPDWDLKAYVLNHCGILFQNNRYQAPTISQVSRHFMSNLTTAAS